MRLLNFLTEDIDKLVPLLKNNEIIDLYKKNNEFLYRGKNIKIQSYKIFDRRKDRKPLDMIQHLHDDFDKAFQKKFGWKARSEGVFAVSDSWIAEKYGTPYIFIPIKPFTYLYSSYINDLHNDIKVVNNNISYEDSNILKYPTEENKEKYYKIIDKIVNSYRDKYIQHAFRGDQEIMFNCDKYILIKYDDMQELLKKL